MTQQNNTMNWLIQDANGKLIKLVHAFNFISGGGLEIWGLKIINNLCTLPGCDNYRFINYSLQWPST